MGVPKREFDVEVDPAGAVELLLSRGIGILGTLSVDPAGYPFGSVMPYALTSDGDLVLLASTLSEHTRNFLANPQVSLFVAAEEKPRIDPQSLPRLTLLGRVVPGTDEDKAAYIEAHTSARGYTEMKDFGFYRLQVEYIRYIGGFAAATWVPLHKYRDAFAAATGGDLIDV